MKDTTKVMLESDFGFNTSIFSKNREILEEIEIISEDIRNMTGFTPEKVLVLNDGNNIYIEFANNLERLMNDANFDLKEAIDAVMVENKIANCNANIILDGSCVDKINLEELIEVIGKEHVFRK